MVSAWHQPSHPAQLIETNGLNIFPLPSREINHYCYSLLPLAGEGKGEGPASGTRPVIPSVERKHGCLQGIFVILARESIF